MVALGIGVRSPTLPVIALGVIRRVDYALYLLSVQRAAAAARACRWARVRWTLHRARAMVLVPFHAGRR